MRNCFLSRTGFILVMCLVAMWLAGCIKTSQMSRSQLNSRKSALESEIKSSDQRLAAINAEIAKHQNNIKKMRETLKQAKNNDTQPDISLLDQIATATGQRTQHYHDSPPWLQALYDEFENATVKNAMAGGTMAFLTLTAGSISTANFIMEISRSNQFIKILEREKEKLQTTRTSAVNELESINQSLGQPASTSIPSSDDSQSGGY